MADAVRHELRHEKGDIGQHVFRDAPVQLLANEPAGT
jgi:hypothetical protein